MHKPSGPCLPKALVTVAVAGRFASGMILLINAAFQPTGEYVRTAGSCRQQPGTGMFGIRCSQHKSNPSLGSQDSLSSEILLTYLHMPRSRLQVFDSSFCQGPGC